jgi:trk system potassium uptake protein TrkH
MIAMFQFTGSLTKYPARASLLWYAGIIAAGAILLWMPACHGGSGRSISPLDALFTSTSATCVTGLVVRSTEHDFTFWGQLVILLLIQIGGIGIMTITTFMVFQFGGHGGLRDRVALSETLGAEPDVDLKWILRNVILMTAIFEGVGFLLLAVRGLFDHPPLTALWHALFHSVSAFCNAGFALHDDSLTRYQGDPLVNATICALVITGGLGFPVILDLKRNWYGTWRDRWDRLHLHSKLMLIGTATLLVVSTVAILWLEWDDALQSMPVFQRPLVAFFHAVSSRTAGFNTLEVASLTNASLFITVLLMLIGAGACSTAGGLKVSTVMVLILRARDAFLGKGKLHLFRRTVPRGTIDRAMVTTMLFLVTVFVALTMLLVIEQSSGPHPESQDVFLDALFEVASALGTVGLSTGVTPQLTAAGRVIVIVLMFLGRLGPISVFAALSRSEREEKVEFPGESPLIG